MFRSVDAYPLSCHSHSVRDSCFDSVIMDLLHIVCNVVLPSMQCLQPSFHSFPSVLIFVTECFPLFSSWSDCVGWSVLLILIRLCWMKCSLSCTCADERLEMLDVQSQHFTGTFKLLHVHQNSGQYHDLMAFTVYANCSNFRLLVSYIKLQYSFLFEVYKNSMLFWAVVVFVLFFNKVKITERKKKNVVFF